MIGLHFTRLFELGLSIMILGLFHTETKANDKPKVWSGNLQFSEDGYLKQSDIQRIQHEIKVI